MVSGMDRSALFSVCESCDDHIMGSLSDTVKFKCSVCDAEVYKALCKPCASLSRQHQCMRCSSDIVAVPDRSALLFVLEEIGLPLPLEALEMRQDRTFAKTGPNTVEKPGGGDETIGPYNRGGLPYYMPAGWTRHGFSMDTDCMSGVDEWNVGFIGSRGLLAKSIVEAAQPKVSRRAATAQVMLMVEDSPSTTTFSLERSPAMVSPSVEYASCAAFSSIVKLPAFRDTWCRVAFQCRVRPGSFSVREESVGWSALYGTQIDPHYANSDLEWWVGDSRDVVVYGVLTQLVFGEPPVDYSGGKSQPRMASPLLCRSMILRASDDDESLCISCKIRCQAVLVCNTCSQSICRPCVGKVNYCPQCVGPTLPTTMISI